MIERLRLFRGFYYSTKLLIVTKNSQTICENRTESLRVSLEKARLPHRGDLAFLVLNNFLRGSKKDDEVITRRKFINFENAYEGN